MHSQPFVWVGLFVGSTIGGLIPGLWHAGLFSFSGLLLSTVGGILGIYLGYKLSNN